MENGVRSAADGDEAGVNTGGVTTGAATETRSAVGDGAAGAAVGRAGSAGRAAGADGAGVLVGALGAAWGASSEVRGAGGVGAAVVASARHVGLGSAEVSAAAVDPTAGMRGELTSSVLSGVSPLGESHMDGSPFSRASGTSYLYH